jgi:hypothetical protein
MTHFFLQVCAADPGEANTLLIDALGRMGCTYNLVHTEHAEDDEEQARFIFAVVPDDNTDWRDTIESNTLVDHVGNLHEHYLLTTQVDAPLYNYDC